MDPMVRDYLMKKRGLRTVVDLETPGDAVTASLPRSNEPTPDLEPEPTPDEMPNEGAAAGYDAMADLKAAQAAAKQDESRRRFLEGASRVNDAVTGAGVLDYSKNNDVADAKERSAMAREYVMNKYRDRLGRAQEMNAEAALNNSRRQRQVAVAKPEKVDPLLEDKRGLIHAQTAKALRVPTPKLLKAQKAGKNVNEGLPEGYEASPDNPPSEDNRKKFTALVFSRDKMSGLTSQMRNALKRAGSFGANIPGALKDEIAGLATMIQIEAKNVAELGALSGPDMGLIEAIVADPSKISNVLRNIPTQLNGLDNWAGNSVSAGLKAYGVRKRGAAPTVASAEGGGKAPETKTVGGKVYTKQDGRWVLQ